MAVCLWSEHVSGVENGAQRAEYRVERSGAVSGRCRKMMERSEARSGMSQRGNGAASGDYRNRLERGAAFSPLTLRSNPLTLRSRSAHAPLTLRSRSAHMLCLWHRRRLSKTYVGAKPPSLLSLPPLFLLPLSSPFHSLYSHFLPKEPGERGAIKLPQHVRAEPDRQRLMHFSMKMCFW